MGCAGSSSGEPKPQFHDTYKLGKKLGEGAFGQVRLAERKPTVNGAAGSAPKRAGDKAAPQEAKQDKDGKGVSFKQEYAVKVIDVRISNEFGEKKVDKDLVKSTRLEADLWKQLGRHEHCVELIEAFLEQRLCYMVMERCQCTLMDKLVKSPTTKHADLVRVLREMILGIQHVHKVGIIHRDVKPENFLYGGDSAQTVKICDFGLAAKLPKKGTLKGVCGTPPYMSPEMLKNSLYDYRTDVWSFGATVYLMLYGDFPYSPEEVSTEGMKRAIRIGYPEPSYKRAEDSAQTVGAGEQLERAGEFVKALLNRDPQQRGTCEEALKLPFLTEKPSEKDEGDLMEPVIRRARKVTVDFKNKTRKVDPTVQHDIDELLQRLQAKAHGSSELAGQTSLFFSEEDDNNKKKMKSRTLDSDTMEDRIVVRGDKRMGTHSGTIGSGTGLKAMDPLDKEAIKAKLDGPSKTAEEDISNVAVADIHLEDKTYEAQAGAAQKGRGL